MDFKLYLIDNLNVKCENSCKSKLLPSIINNIVCVTETEKKVGGRDRGREREREKEMCINLF